MLVYLMQRVARVTSPLAVKLVLSLSLASLAACGGSRVVGDPVSAQPEGSAEASDDSATLDILADQPTSILLDGKPIGKTPLKRYKVAPGSHDVTFVDERQGNRTMAVTVGPNEAHTVKADNPPKRIAPQAAESDQ